MTSMLLSVSITMVCARKPRPGARRGAVGRRLRLLSRLLDVLGHHVLIGGEPVRHLHELTALDLPDLEQPAALVVLRRDLERRDEPPQGEVVDLLEALLRVLARDLAPGL